MGDQHQRHAGIGAQRQEQPHDRGRVLRIEVSRRLVRQEQLWPVGEAARDRDALALTARQRERKMFCAVAEPDLIQQRRRTLAPFRRRQTGAAHRNLDILDRRQRRQQQELLEHDSDLVSAQRRPCPAIAHGLALPQDAARAWQVEAGHDVDEAGLAAAARTDDRHELAATNRHADAAQRDDRAVVEYPADTVEGNQRRRCFFQGCCTDVFPKAPDR